MTEVQAEQFRRALDALIVRSIGVSDQLAALVETVGELQTRVMKLSAQVEVVEKRTRGRTPDEAGLVG
jgi:hypothetical protein